MGSSIEWHDDAECAEVALALDTSDVSLPSVSDSGSSDWLTGTRVRPHEALIFAQ